MPTLDKNENMKLFKLTQSLITTILLILIGVFVGYYLELKVMRLILRQASQM